MSAHPPAPAFGTHAKPVVSFTPTPLRFTPLRSTPLTHQVTKVCISDIRSMTYYARLYLTLGVGADVLGSREVVMDMRPSGARARCFLGGGRPACMTICLLGDGTTTLCRQPGIFFSWKSGVGGG